MTTNGAFVRAAPVLLHLIEDPSYGIFVHSGSFFKPHFTGYFITNRRTKKLIKIK
jgi:hypothetical protein